MTTANLKSKEKYENQLTELLLSEEALTHPRSKYCQIREIIL